jgi:hypothetical protein
MCKDFVFQGTFLDYGHRVVLIDTRIQGRFMRESKKDSGSRPVRPTLLSILAPILKDLGLARKRIGKLGTARWLFEFAYKSDLESLSAGEIINYGFDSLVLVIPKDPKAMDDHELLYAVITVSLFTTPEKDRDAMWDTFQAVLISPQKTLEEYSARLELLKQTPPAGLSEWLFDFHDELRKHFDGFFTGHYWTHIELPTMKFLLCPGVRPHDDVLRHDLDDPDSGKYLPPVKHLMFVAGRAVSAEKEKFGICERCKKPFIAEKNPLRKFCSDTCAQYVRTTRYRQKHK